MSENTLHSVEEVAEAAKKTPQWIRALGDEFISAGLAQKVGKVLVFTDLASAVAYILNRPDNRGRPKAQK